MKNLILGSILLLLPLIIQAQSAVFNVSPGGGFVRVGDMVLDLSKSRTLELSPGTYEAEIWVPRFEVVRREVVVQEGRPTVVNLAMKTLTNDFNEFREELSRFKTARLKRSLRDGAAVGLVVGLGYVTLTGNRNKLKGIEERIVNLQSGFSGAVSLRQIEDITEQYDNEVADYESTQKSHNTLVVATGVLAAVSGALAVKYFTSKSRSKETKPVFSPDNPFVGLPPRLKSSLHPGTSSSMLGFTLKF